ncbi:MAG: group 1 truncated hemoglobin [Rhodospirillaceae bacterium]|nr:group 1 truncated hemoglobin [Rhodospirillaceae bacterium]
MATLLDRIGGDAAVTLAVDRFYDKILADALLAPFFAHSNMEQQRKKQARFLSSVMGGTAVNVDGYMRNAHRRYVKDMGLTDRHFDAVAGHLQSTLNDLGVKPDVAGEVMAAAASLRESVLDR